MSGPSFGGFWIQSAKSPLEATMAAVDAQRMADDRDGTWTLRAVQTSPGWWWVWLHVEGRDGEDAYLFCNDAGETVALQLAPAVGGEVTAVTFMSSSAFFVSKVTIAASGEKVAEGYVDDSTPVPEELQPAEDNDAALLTSMLLADVEKSAGVGKLYDFMTSSYYDELSQEISERQF